MKLTELFKTEMKWSLGDSNYSKGISTTVWNTNLDDFQISLSITARTEDNFNVDAVSQEKKTELFKIMDKNNLSFMITMYIEFSVAKGNTKMRMDITGKAKEKSFAIISGIVNKIKKEIKKENPHLVFFSANTHETSRISLYKTLAKRAPSIGYKLFDVNECTGATCPEWDFTHIILIREDLLNKNQSP